MKEENQNETFPKLFGYAGLIPFIALAILIKTGPELDRHLFVMAQLVYGAVILSFLGGVVWGRMLKADVDKVPARDRHVVYSVIPPLLGWAALLLEPFYAFLTLSIGFVLALAYDWGLGQHQVFPAWYLRMRLWLTLIVVFSLMSVARA